MGARSASDFGSPRTFRLCIRIALKPPVPLAASLLPSKLAALSVGTFSRNGCCHVLGPLQERVPNRCPGVRLSPLFPRVGAL